MSKRQERRAAQRANDQKPLAGISDYALATLGPDSRPLTPIIEMPLFTPQQMLEPYRPPAGVVPKGVTTTMASDEAFPFGDPAGYGSGLGVWGQGLGFLGYPFLAELSQRPEYRRASEIIAKEMTRKWIKLKSSGDKKKGKADRIKQIEEAIIKHRLRDVFRDATELDGFFGRGQIYIDTGHTDEPNVLPLPLVVDKRTVKKGALKGFRTVEPIWTSPNRYDTTNPLSEHYYKPQTWFVNGLEVHRSRLLTLISRKLPDILKPAYNFGGLSLSQLGMPYVNNWLRTRQSVSDITHSFSVPVLKTTLGDLLNQGAATQIVSRAVAFNRFRDNRGLFVVDMEKEDFDIASAQLSGLDKLQAQAQEHMCLSRGTLVETDRGQIPVENVVIGDRVMTRNGYAPVAWAGITKYVSSFVEIETDISTIRVTEEHPIWSETADAFVSAMNVNRFHRLRKSRAWVDMGAQSHGAGDYGAAQMAGISATLKRAVSCIASFTKRISAQFPPVMTSIIWTKTQAIMSFLTLNLYVEPITTNGMGQKDSLSELNKNIQKRASSAEMNFSHPCRRGHSSARIGADRLDISENTRATWSAGRLGKSTKQNMTKTDECVRVRRTKLVTTREAEPVYDITVADGFLPEFYANGILVHNSSVWGIPLIILLGITPSGLNASSDGEIRTFYAWIKSQQEALYNDPLKTCLDLIQLSEFGDIDDEITFEYVPLWELDDAGLASVQKAKADTNAVYLADGVVSNEEVREQLANDDDSPYSSLNLADTPPPEPEPDDEDAIEEKPRIGGDPAKSEIGKSGV